MRVGVPKEIKTQEHRVGLTPMAVREYTALGHVVLVQAGAGAGIGAADAAYVAAGARIAADAAEVFAELDGIVHYCVANIPGAVPMTSSHALSQATLPFGLALAAKGERALVDDLHLRRGLNVHRGRITCAAVAQAQSSTAVSAESALGM